MINTRYAPSPTGFMHIGNLRSALYSYLAAKSKGGNFFLRIEDTDKEREVEGAIDIIYKTLEKCELYYDNKPYIQSEHKENYRKFAQILIDKGMAYYCVCEKDSTQECMCNNLIFPPESTYAIRFKMPKSGTTSYIDEVFGEIVVENKTLDDIVLIKRDGFPTYNFAHIIDDYSMGITHVLRGSEYLASTPKYVNIYKAFGWKLPHYIHLPLIMGKDEDGKISKLSKRHGAVSFDDLSKQGYLSSAIINYIAFLGWNPKTNKEIFSLEELREEFSTKKINKAPAVFDYKKLDWFNKQYLSKLSDEDFLSWFIGGANDYLPVLNFKIKYLISLLKGRVSNFKEANEKLDFFFNPKELNKEYLGINYLESKSLKNILYELKNIDKEITSVDEANDYLKDICIKLNEPIKSVAWVIRISLTKSLTTPGGATDFLYIYDNIKEIFEKTYELLFKI